MTLRTSLWAGIAGMAELLPQESEHRREVMRNYLGHRGRMYRLQHERPNRTSKRRTE
ncbi:hypothetical protein [Streptomyces sp. NPDC003480]